MTYADTPSGVFTMRKRSLFFSAGKLFREDPRSFVFSRLLFPRGVICSPTTDVELSLMNVDTSTRGLSDGRPFGEYERDIAHGRRMQRAAKWKKNGPYPYRSTESRDEIRNGSRALPRSYARKRGTKVSISRRPS